MMTRLRVFSGVLASEDRAHNPAWERKDAMTARAHRRKQQEERGVTIWILLGVRSSPTTYALRSKTAAFFTLFFGVTLSGEEMDQYFAALSGLSAQ